MLQAVVPTLYHLYFSLADTQACAGPLEHVWHGRWLGPPTELRLRFGGAVRVRTSRGVDLAKEGPETWIDFPVETGAEVEIRLTARWRVIAALYAPTAVAERVPYWEWVEPLPIPPDLVGPPAPPAG